MKSNILNLISRVNVTILLGGGIIWKKVSFKVIVHPKNTNSVIYYSCLCHSKPASSSLEHNLRYFLWTPRAFLPSIDSNATPAPASAAPHAYMSWYSHKHTSKTDVQEKKLLNKVIIFVFFAHKKYSHSFIKMMVEPLMLLGLFEWCPTLLALNMVVALLSLQGTKALGFHQK